MAKSAILFFSEDITFVLKDKLKIKRWITDTIQAENHSLGELNFIFCSDSYLLNINQQYLSHDTYTDIITFDNTDTPGVITGDIFISIDRINENALNFGVSKTDELHRVIIHGTLHLLGYPDKGAAAKKLMTAKEDYYLQLREF